MTRHGLARGLAITDVVTFTAASFGDPYPDYAAIVVYLVGITSFVAVGAILVRRVPANPIGGLLLAAGTFAVVSSTAGSFANLGALQVPPWPGSVLARSVGNAFFLYPIVIALVGVPLVFPDGRLPSPRFRWVVLIAIVGLIGWTLNVLFGTYLDVMIMVSFLVSFGGAVTAVILRFRRGDPVQRQQVKWLAAVVCLAAVLFPIGFTVTNDYPDLGNAMVSVGLLALFALPVVIGVAILRYRLYEIDRIISRTLSYAVVTAVLAILFSAGILLLQTVLTPITGGQTIAVAASTLAVFVLFQPVRRRVQTAVDRRFDRARYDGQRMVDAFVGRLRDVIDIGTVTTDLDATVRAAVRPTTLRLWLRRGPTR
jgi:hypothetical protein